jgi:DegT/DnrJ/EryC1/StrS aminotransferase family
MPIQVPFIDLQAELAEIRQKVEPAVRAVIESAQVIMVPQVAQFETSFAEYVGAGYAVGVSNGTEALKLALEAMRVGRSDEVVVPPHTFAASALAVWAAGATPRLVAATSARIESTPPGHVARSARAPARSSRSICMEGWPTSTHWPISDSRSSRTAPRRTVPRATAAALEASALPWREGQNTTR